MYTNIFDIYNRLVQVSNELHDQHDFDEAGFNKCLYLVHYALKQTEDINLHLEITQLNRKIERLELKNDDYLQDREVLRKRISNLNEQIRLIKEENLQLVRNGNRTKPREAIRAKAGFTPVEILFETTPINFLINANAEEFHKHFQDATNYVYSKRKKRVHESTIKCWYLEFYRALGFTCVPN